MPLRFTKMHGLGNDYVYVNTFEQRVADAPALAQAISERHRGVGSDGLILIAPPGADGPPRDADGRPVEADVRMIMYNADGSRSQMCGNGVRCVAKYAYDHGLARRNPLRVATDRGVLTMDLTLDSAGRVAQVRVDMGPPILRPAEIPVALGGERLVSAPIPLAGINGLKVGSGREPIPPMLHLTAVSMGNPHAVFYEPDLMAVPLDAWGPALERHPLFPQRINVHFVQVIRPDYVKMITWERGTGPTQACGTGASAVCVAGVLNNFTQRKLTAALPGGELLLEWDEATQHVFMTGPATEVFEGVWP